MRQEVLVPGACQFNVTFTPAKGGRHTITLCLSGDRAISGSPLAFTVDPSSSNIPSVSCIEMPGRIIVGEEARFTLEVSNVNSDELITMHVSDQSRKSEVVQDVNVPGPCQFQLAFTPIVYGRWNHLEFNNCFRPTSGGAQFVFWAETRRISPSVQRI